MLDFRQKQAINPRKTDLEIFEELPLSDPLTDAKIPSLFLYLYSNKKLAIPPEWQPAMESMRSEMEQYVARLHYSLFDGYFAMQAFVFSCSMCGKILKTNFPPVYPGAHREGPWALGVIQFECANSWLAAIEGHIGSWVVRTDDMLWIFWDLMIFWIFHQFSSKDRVYKILQNDYKILQNAYKNLQTPTNPKK